MATKVFLDDLKEAPRDYIALKNYTEFVTFIEGNQLPTFISFDHDLGEGKSGYDCAKFLVEYCMDHKVGLPEFAVHSQNPVGKENIQRLLENYRKNELLNRS